MPIYVRLKALAGLYESIDDVDRDGVLSVATGPDGVMRGDVVTVRRTPADPGNPAGREAFAVTPADLSSYDTLDAWLEKTTGRRVSFIYGETGEPVFLTYSLAGDGLSLDGVVHLSDAVDYGRTRKEERFTSPDFAGIYTKRDAALAGCEAFDRKREQRRCRKGVETRFETLLRSAEAYTVAFDRLNDAFLAIDGDFQNGTLSEAGLRRYIQQFEQTTAAANAHYSALLPAF